MTFCNGVNTDSNGRITTSDAAVTASDAVRAGFSYDADGAVRVGTLTPTVFHNGFGFNAGRLCVGAGPITTYVAGLPFNSSGQLVTDNAGAVVGAVAGWPVTASGVAIAAPPITVVTWNPSDKGSGITLTNGDLTAAAGATGAGVRANVGRLTGKYYFEVVIDVRNTGSNCPAIGVMDASLSLAVGSGVWYSLNQGACCYPAPSAYTNNGGPVDLSVAFAAADVWGVAFDASTGKLWFRRNGTFVLGGNPGAGTGQQHTLNTGITWYPGLRVVSAQASGRFKASSFTGSLPSGFSAWES